MFKLRNKSQVKRYLSQQVDKIERLLIYNMEYLVEQLQNHAKLSAGYENQTSNLISSIGGVVLKDGKPVSYRGFEGTSEGSKEGNIFISDLIKTAPKGFVLIVVAGMNYATFVENYHGLNVLKKTELKMRRELPRMLNRLADKFK